MFVAALCLGSGLVLGGRPVYAQGGNPDRRPRGELPRERETPVDRAARLLANFQALYLTNAVTPSQQQAVVRSLMAIFPHRNRPATASAGALGTDLAAAVAAGKMTPAQAVKLCRDLAEVFRAGPATLPAAVAVVRADVQSVPSTTRLTAADLQVLANDVNVLILPVLQNAANGLGP